MNEAEMPLCKICGKELNSKVECAWTSCPKLHEWNEKRMDIIGQNGNDALHYEELDNEV